MEFGTILFLFFELMVVITSSYSYEPGRENTLNSRYQRQSTIPQQCETTVLENGLAIVAHRGIFVRYECLPGFTLIGRRISHCAHGLWYYPVPICAKPGCPPVAIPENGYTISAIKGAAIMLFCRRGYSVAGSVATVCNGKTWDRTLGVCREDQASPAMSCDFEVGDMCGWEPDPTHDFEWKRKNGYKSVIQTQTGPRHDHTVGIPLEGHFMLATFATPLPNAVARLISPLYPAAASKDACFQFYYHMYGAVTGFLRIYIKPESLTIAEMLREPKYLYMEKHGSYENAWIESVFNIDEYGQDFQVVIEAATSVANRSNIAIDDVALLSGSECVVEESKSTDVTPEDGGIYFEQSCVNRCEETSPYARYATESSLTSRNKSVNILHCDCFDGCVDLQSCCLDYESVCVFATSNTTMKTGTTKQIVTVLPSQSTTTFVPIFSTGKYTKYYATTPGVAEETPPQNDESHAANISTDTKASSTNLFTASGIVLLIATIAALSLVSFKIYRKHQARSINYESMRYSEGAGDEVRFLTADDQLEVSIETDDF